MNAIIAMQLHSSPESMNSAVYIRPHYAVESLCKGVVLYLLQKKRVPTTPFFCGLLIAKSRGGGFLFIQPLNCSYRTTGRY